MFPHDVHLLYLSTHLAISSRTQATSSTNTKRLYLVRAPLLANERGSSRSSVRVDVIASACLSFCGSTAKYASPFGWPCTMIGTIAWFQEATLAAVASVIASLSIWLFPAAGPLGATLSNGTHAWSPTVIVLSLDGFKPQYLASSLTPTLASLAANGSWMSRGERHASNNVLAAEYMLPASPSLTFPNHWSIQTGLQPSGHGIIANDFHLAPDEHGRIRPNSSFYYTDPARSWDPKWWKGVSMWEHLERRNIATANLMWPGPPVTEHGTQSTHFQRYEKGWSLQQRHDRVFEWLDLEVSQRPQFICGELEVK